MEQKLGPLNFPHYPKYKEISNYEEYLQYHQGDIVKEYVEERLKISKTRTIFVISDVLTSAEFKQKQKNNLLYLHQLRKNESDEFENEKQETKDQETEERKVVDDGKKEKSQDLKDDSTKEEKKTKKQWQSPHLLSLILYLYRPKQKWSKEEKQEKNVNHQRMHRVTRKRIKSEEVKVTNESEEVTNESEEVTNESKTSPPPTSLIRNESQSKAIPTTTSLISESENKTIPTTTSLISESENKTIPTTTSLISESENKTIPTTTSLISESENKTIPTTTSLISESENKTIPTTTSLISESENKTIPTTTTSLIRNECESDASLITSKTIPLTRSKSNTIASTSTKKHSVAYITFHVREFTKMMQQEELSLKTKKIRIDVFEKMLEFNASIERMENWQYTEVFVKKLYPNVKNENGLRRFTGGCKYYAQYAEMLRS